MPGAPLGEIIYSAVKPMIRMYMIIGTGFFLTKKGLFGVTAARACSDMVLMLFMPALVFDNIVSYISIDDIKTIGVICFLAFVMYAINACMAFAVVYFTPVPKNPKDRWVGGGLLAGIMQNVSDLPISYIQAVSIFTSAEQHKGTAYVIIWLAMYVLVQFNFGLFQLVEWDFKFTEKHYHGEDQDLEKNNESLKGKESLTDDVNIQEDNDTSHTADSKASSNISTNMNDAPNIYTQNSRTSESPLSSTSSILTEFDDEDDLDSHIQQIEDLSQSSHHRARSNSHSLNPRPLTLINSRISQLSRRSTTIARIPSARSANYDLTHIDSQIIDNDDILSLNQELVKEFSHVEPYNQKMTKAMRIVTETNLKMEDVQTAGTNHSFVKKYHLHHVIFFLENFKKPNSISLILSLTIALIPWTKALFVDDGTVRLPNAPDNEAPLSFILMYAQYLGYPCVPLGLLLIGSVLARLEFTDVPEGLWKSAVSHTVFRLGVLPIIGMTLVAKLKNNGWLTDKMSLFVCALEFALPSATVQIYLTAGAMKPDMKTCAPLNCFGVYLALQYIVLVISMPIVVCYCVKNVMDM